MTEPILMATRTGRLLDLRQLREEDIDTEDIAHSLSLICRWTGHTRGFYSVAQHCVLAAQCARDAGLSIAEQRWALLHDAAEAYLGDISRPMKSVLPVIQDLEGRAIRSIARRYALDPVDQIPPSVQLIDRRLLATEWYQLLYSSAIWDTWTPDADPFSFTIYADNWVKAKKSWYEMFNELFPEEGLEYGTNLSD